VKVLGFSRSGNSEELHEELKMLIVASCDPELEIVPPKLNP
jgi:hypothetical protein